MATLGPQGKTHFKENEAKGEVCKNNHTAATGKGHWITGMESYGTNEVRKKLPFTRKNEAEKHT